mgnify:FL=1
MARKPKVNTESLQNFLNIHSKRMINNPTKWELQIRKTLSDLHYNFKTQVPYITKKLKGYIIDFLLTDYNIIIEIDGKSTHSSKAQVKKDNKRANDLKKEGFAIIRLWNSQVTRYSPQDIDDIIQNKINMLKSLEIKK